MPAPMLHLLCGKIAAGKSTLAAALGKAPATVIVSEDHWLPALYPGEITSLADYVRCAARLRTAMAPHLAGLLRAGLSVVLDFPANTVANRAWMRAIVQDTGAEHVLHVLDVPDAVCKLRLHARNADGAHPYTVSEEDFALFTSHFMPPAAEEGFNLVIHRAES